MKILIGSDHDGFCIKQQIKNSLIEQGYEIEDIGCENNNRCDYPIIAQKLCQKINDTTRGILICGTGIGMGIQANRYKHIRCGVCHDIYAAEMTRKHNNANVIALGARITNEINVINIVEVFLKTEFEGGRHQNRINQII